MVRGCLPRKSKMFSDFLESGWHAAVNLLPDEIENDALFACQEFDPLQFESPIEKNPSKKWCRIEHFFRKIALRWRSVEDFSGTLTSGWCRIEHFFKKIAL